MTRGIEALEAELAQLRQERDAALARERAAQQALAEAMDRDALTPQILAAISRTPIQLEKVLETIGNAARRLCDADATYMFVVDEENNVYSWNHTTGYVNTPRANVRAEFQHLLNASRDTRTFCGGIEDWPADDPAGLHYARLEGLTAWAQINVPMQSTTFKGGALIVRRATPRPFDPACIPLLERFAAHAVIAIQTSHFVVELEQRNAALTDALRREEASSDILRQISRAPEELDETLAAIANAGVRLAGLDRVGVFLIDGDEAVLRADAWSDGELLFEAPMRAPLAGVYAHAMQTRKPHFTQYGEEYLPGTDIDFERRLTDSGLRSRGLVPILRGDDVVGFLGAGNTSGDPIPEPSIALLLSFADQAAIAIENARLIRELRDSNREISENLDVRRVMGEVLAIVASAPSDLKVTLPKIAKAAQALTAADVGAAVSWIDGVRLIICPSIEGEWIERPWDPQGAAASIGHRAIREAREVEWRGDLDAMRREYPLMADFSTVQRNGSSTFSQSVLAVPMTSSTGAFGALSILSDGLVEFPERSRSILRALATQAVVAIENARLFRQLQEKTEALEVASRHKSEFLANMSHELRTPLNAIIGYAELLQEECEDLGQQEFMPDLGKIHSAGKHLLTLISGILDLSKVEAGRMTMFLEDFDIATLVRDADAIVRPLVEKNGNGFVIDCPDDIGTMHADLVKVRQVLFNLLSNSAKFTSGGSITLTVRKLPEAATVVLAIRDTGIGMTEEQVGRLFAAFSQASAETSRKYGGTGLGLALSREFCRMMGGDIAVESVAGAGSTFTVTLPVAVKDREPDGNAASVH